MQETEAQEYVKKRVLILDALKSLIGYWDMAEWLHSLVGSQYVTKDLIDNIIQMLSDARDTMKEGEQKQKLEGVIDILQKMREQEEKDRVIDKLLAERILESLNYI